MEMHTNSDTFRVCACPECRVCRSMHRRCRSCIVSTRAYLCMQFQCTMHVQNAGCVWALEKGGIQYSSYSYSIPVKQVSFIHIHIWYLNQSFCQDYVPITTQVSQRRSRIETKQSRLLLRCNKQSQDWSSDATPGYIYQLPCVTHEASRGTLT